MKQNNLIINGNGTSSGGEYHKVRINGKGKVQGDVVCDKFVANGVTDMKGNLEAKESSVSGEVELEGNWKGEKAVIRGQMEIEGNINLNNLKVQGKADIKGSSYAKDLKVEGMMEVKQNITGNVVNVVGSLSVKGDCEVEHFYSKGAVTVQGLLNAETVEMFLYGKNKVKEIGGQKVEVKKTDPSWKFLQMVESLFRLSIQRTLEVDVVEGDTVYLEHTKAKVVRGKNVTFGPGCEIDLVEYQDSLEKDPKTVVKEEMCV